MRTSALLRVFVTLATFVVVWMVAPRVAHAGAPLCDPRGAIMFAPPPQMQDPEQSLDVVAPCDGHEDPLAARHVTPHRGGATVDISFSREPAMWSTFAVPAVPSLERLAAPEQALSRPPAGVRSSVERPPRA